MKRNFVFINIPYSDKYCMCRILYFKKILVDIMSEWLLLNTNSAIFQLYHDENKLIFNEMMMKSTLYWTNTLSWNFIVLAHRHWNNSPLIDMSTHSDTLSWFQASKSLLFSPYCSVISREATNTNYIVFGFTRSGLEPTIYCTRGEHGNHYTTNEPTIYRTRGKHGNHYTTNEPTIYRTRGEHGDHYTTNAVTYR
jgi:hypothetical protein